jgi:hypothetical protein
MAVLLGRDVGNQVVERPQLPATTEAERLQRVVHQRRHLAEAPIHQLLHRHRAGRIRIAGGNLNPQSVIAKNHVSLLFVDATNRSAEPSATTDQT